MIGGYSQDFPAEKEHLSEVAQSEARLRALAPHKRAGMLATGMSSSHLPRIFCAALCV